mgnify:CR=1 FL=1
MSQQSKWLECEQSAHTGKTVIVRVVSKMRGDILGTIRWYGAWRQYAFYPSQGTLFNVGCLEDIQAFIRELMESRKDHPHV